MPRRGEVWIMPIRDPHYKIKELETRELIYDAIPKGGVGAELGACRGNNAVQLFFRTKPSTMFLVDKWVKMDRDHEMTDLWYDDYSDSVAEIFAEEIEQGMVVLRKQHTTSFLGSLPDDCLDWVYLDSNHHYQNVSREIDLSLKKVKSGGYIMGHDYFPNPKIWGTSVIRAVNERIQNQDIAMKAITNEAWPTYLTEVL